MFGTRKEQIAKLEELNTQLFQRLSQQQHNNAVLNDRLAALESLINQGTKINTTVGHRSVLEYIKKLPRRKTCGPTGCQLYYMVPCSYIDQFPTIAPQDVEPAPSAGEEVKTVADNIRE